MTDDLILGVDVGQTSTKALLARTDGTVIGRGRGGPADHFRVAGGFARNRDAIQVAIRSTYATAAITPGPVRAAALGVTGIQGVDTAAKMVGKIVTAVIAPGTLAVYPDYVTNLAGASAGADGVVVIAGGGSIAYGTDADGAREAVAGGYGYLLGDEGSAFDIGRTAIVAATRAADGRGDATALVQVILDAFAVGDVRDIRPIVYSSDFSRERISRLAPLVIATADRGDKVARRIVLTAAEELAATALAVVRAIALPGEEIPVYPTGGVFAAQSILAPFTGAVQSAWPQAEIRQPAFPPVVGALIKARQAVSGDVDEPWLARVRQSLAGI